jgi:hypothetical protein
MKLPRALAEINAELYRRDGAGECVEVVDVKPLVLRDERVGLFLRMSLTLADGTDFTIDTLEFADLLRTMEAH